MDEPLANLDAGLRLEMRSEIGRIQRESSITSILVTHDQVEAMSMCDRIALMNKGKIQQIGTPDEMYHQPRNTFVAGFIGNPPISFADGTVEDGHFVSPGLRFELPDRIKGTSVTAGQNISVGIRPESLQPDSATPIEATFPLLKVRAGRFFTTSNWLAGRYFGRSRAVVGFASSVIESVGASMPMRFSSSTSKGIESKFSSFVATAAPFSIRYRGGRIRNQGYWPHGKPQSAGEMMQLDAGSI